MGEGLSSKGRILRRACLLQEKGGGREQREMTRQKGAEGCLQAAVTKHFQVWRARVHANLRESGLLKRDIWVAGGRFWNPFWRTLAVNRERAGHQREERSPSQKGVPRNG